MGWRDAFSTSEEERPAWYGDRWWRSYLPHVVVYVALFWAASWFIPGLRVYRSFGFLVPAALIWAALMKVFWHYEPRMKRWWNLRSRD